MTNKRQLSIVMVTYNSFPFFQDSVNLLLQHIKDIEIEIIIADNNSTQIETLQCLDELSQQNKNIKIIKLAKNGGFSTAINIGINYASYEFILILDNDVFIDSSADEHFKKMYDLIENNLDYGLISPLFTKEDKTPDINYFINFKLSQMIYERFSRIFSDKSKHASLERLEKIEKDKNGCIGVDVIAGQFFLMRKNIYFNILKGWDTRYFLGIGDTDLCEALRFYGLRTMIYPNIKFVHGISKTNNNDSVRSIVIYDNFKSTGQFLMKWKIIPFFRNLIYKLIFTIPAWGEIVFRKLSGNKTVSD